jgi:hypothetical protein
MAECEHLLYISNGNMPNKLDVKFHVFSNWSLAPELSKDSNTERCTVDFSILENGRFAGHFGIDLPPLYHIMSFHVEEPFRAFAFDPHRQTFFAHFELEVSGWKCGRHFAKALPPEPIRIASRSLIVRWSSDFDGESIDLPAHSPSSANHQSNVNSYEESLTGSAIVVSWMLSLKRRPERWDWGRATAARAGLDVARWLVVDGRRSDARSCIDSETAFARSLEVRSIQPYTALSCALSHKLLHILFLVKSTAPASTVRCPAMLS